jgi:Type II secretory pathway, component ExeA (predicted ATPase)
MQGILSGVAERCPVMLLVSAEGRGKSTFLSCLAPAFSVAAVPTDVFVIAADSPGDWLEEVAAAFDMPAEDLGREAAIETLRIRLAEHAQLNSQVLIAIDDAHRLSSAAMADVLAFAGGWPDGRVQASVLLAGRPDVSERVAAVIPLREARAIPRFSLTPWGIDDLASFIRHRLASQTLGHQRFGHEAIARVHELSAGEPVTVSRMVARSLQFAQQTGQASVARVTVDYAATSLATRPFEVEASAARAGPLYASPVGSASVGASGLADGKAQAPLHGPSSAGGGQRMRPRVGGARGGPNALQRYRRSILGGVAALALLVVGAAVWSQLHDWERSGNRAVVVPRSAPAEPDTGDVAARGESARPDREHVSTPATTTEPPTPQAASATDPAPPDSGTAVASAAPDAAAPTVSPPEEAAPAVPATDVAPGPATGPAIEGTAALMQRGDSLMHLSDVSTARQFYLLAARRGDPAAYTAVAGTYDPVFLQSSGIRGIRGDARQAIEWYREAMRRGEPWARTRLVSLLSHLRATGEIDGDEAKRLLDERS